MNDTPLWRWLRARRYALPQQAGGWLPAPDAAAGARIARRLSRRGIAVTLGYFQGDADGADAIVAAYGRIAAAPLPHAEYHFVAGTLGASQRHPLSTVLGDLLVHFSSATGVGRTGPVVEGARFEYVPSAHHFALLNHPTVAGWLVEWVRAAHRPVRALSASGQD